MNLETILLFFLVLGCKDLEAASRYSYSYSSRGTYRAPTRYTYRAPTRYTASSYTYRSYSYSYAYRASRSTYRSSTYRAPTSLTRYVPTRYSSYRTSRGSYSKRYYPYSSYLTPYFHLYVSSSSVYASRSRSSLRYGGTWCKNYDYVNGSQLGMFKCPMTFEPSDYTYCCGYSQAEYCCRIWDSPGKVAGIVIGIILGVLIIGLIVGCCIKKSVQKKKARVSPHTSRARVQVTQMSGTAPVMNVRRAATTTPAVHPGHVSQQPIYQTIQGVPVYPPPNGDPAYPPMNAMYPPPPYSSLIHPSAPPPPYQVDTPVASTSTVAAVPGMTPSPFNYTAPS